MDTQHIVAQTKYLILMQKLLAWMAAGKLEKRYSNIQQAPMSIFWQGQICGWVILLCPEPRISTVASSSGSFQGLLVTGSLQVAIAQTIVPFYLFAKQNKKQIPFLLSLSIFPCKKLDVSSNNKPRTSVQRKLS